MNQSGTCWVGLAGGLIGVLLGLAGCEDRPAHRSAPAEEECACATDCPPGVCDVEVTINPGCPRAIPLVVDGQEVAELEPGETWHSCQQTWAVDQRVQLTVRAGFPLRFAEQPLCTEAVDHIRTRWDCP